MAIFEPLSTNFRNQRWYPVSRFISLVKSDHYTSNNDHFWPYHVMDARSCRMNLTGYFIVRVTNVEVIEARNLIISIRSACWLMCLTWGKISKKLRFYNCGNYDNLTWTTDVSVNNIIALGTFLWYQNSRCKIFDFLESLLNLIPIKIDQDESNEK